MCGFVVPLVRKLTASTHNSFTFSVENGVTHSPTKQNWVRLMCDIIYFSMNTTHPFTYSSTHQHTEHSEINAIVLNWVQDNRTQEEKKNSLKYKTGIRQTLSAHSVHPHKRALSASISAVRLPKHKWAQTRTCGSKHPAIMAPFCLKSQRKNPLRGLSEPLTFSSEHKLITFLMERKPRNGREWESPLTT